MSSAAPSRAVPAEVARWRDQYESFRATLPPGPPDWLRALRAAAMDTFEELGFPTTRQEDWQQTSVAAIARATFQRADPEPALPAQDMLSAVTFGHAFDGHQLVFVNGRHAPSLSSAPMTDGVTIRSLREVLDREPHLVQAYLDKQAGGPGRPFTSLNSAFLDDGAVVLVPPGNVLAEPIHLVFFASAPDGVATVSHPRVLVVAGRASQVTIVESYGGARKGHLYFTNAVSEVVVEDGAVVDHYRLQRESSQAFHVGALAVRQGRASRFSSHVIALGAALSRIDIRQAFAGEGGECVLNGLFLAGGRQHTDVHTWVDHAQPHCTTRELYKGIVDDQAHGVFVGNILVRAGAQKTDAIQSNKNLVLSRDALVDSVPQLEILNDDVKCKHGSTTGQLDPLALFYLRSRGIGEEAARELLTYAFASDIVQKLGVEALRTGLTEHLQRRLPGPADLKEAVV